MPAEEFHDEDTLMKAAEAARRVVGHEKAHDVVLEMQNAGILFRERKSDAG